MSRNQNSFLKFWDQVYKGVPMWDIDYAQPVFQALLRVRNQTWSGSGCLVWTRRKRYNVSYERL